MWSCTQGKEPSSLRGEGPHPSTPFLFLRPLEITWVSVPGVETPSELPHPSARRAGDLAGQTSETLKMKLTVVLVRRKPSGCWGSEEFVAMPGAD